MIDVKDIRIDNWLKHLQQDSPAQVLEINLIGKEGHGTINGWSYKEWSPLPLTRELLEKCRISKIKNGFMSPDVFEKKYTKRIVVNSFILHFDGKDGYWMEGSTIVEVNYLHELQNLYVALTGQELECNL
jgi:hypothetical protein